MSAVNAPTAAIKDKTNALIKAFEACVLEIQLKMTQGEIKQMNEYAMQMRGFIAFCERVKRKQDEVKK